jgi:hypothetical protein
MKLMHEEERPFIRRSGNIPKDKTRKVTKRRENVAEYFILR